MKKNVLCVSISLIFLTSFTGAVKINTNKQLEPRFEEVAVINLEELEKLEQDSARKLKAEKIDEFFSKGNMPLEGYGYKFVEVAEKYNLPYNLLPAIAAQESTGGKRCINNNPFGWGSGKIKFKNFEESIEVVGEKMANHKYYKDKTIAQKLFTYNKEDKKYQIKIFSFMKKIDEMV